jgi:myo-inositol-1(or 4)-monophosphatase
VTLDWEVRKTGSASLECAFVAAGLLRVARFERPHLWDVAAGLALLEAAGRIIRERTDDGWQPMAPVEAEAIAGWRRPLVVGAAAAGKRLIPAREG